MNDEIKEILKGLQEDIDNNALIEVRGNYFKPLLDYITNLQEEKDKYKMRCYNALKMIWDNYGLLDKYGIEMLEDILEGKSDE